jgi:adenylate cyclase class IV
MVLSSIKKILRKLGFSKDYAFWKTRAVYTIKTEKCRDVA